MLRLLNLALMRGTRLLYAHANLIASPGERIGLVGPNGCGKSTLFAAILGDLAPEDGELETPPHERIAHVAQSFTVEDISCIDCVLSGHAPLMNAKAALKRAEASGDEMALAAAHSELAEVNEGAVVAQAKAILAGLGFAEADSCRKVHDFSGGWRNRIQLARALMRPADLLLLDEPTNHLDIDSLIWLENWLRRVEATVIIISHDREFLDRAVNTIWSVEDGTICRYAGNYSQFELARIEKLRAQESARRAYETQAAHLTSFIERFRAKATKARQAQSRIKMLEKLQAVEPVRAKREWRFNFLKPLRLPEHLVDGENLKIGYGDKVVLSGVSFSIRSGERIGILGVNGAGKSTLVKAIVGELTPMSGELRRGQGLEIGYFAQHQLDQLRMDETPLEHLRHLAPDAREQELRDFLGTYRFSGDFAEAKVAPMSGGEKARLALALIAWKKPNLLVLDEPTNHLDMRSKDVLKEAIREFDGTVILVSHDRDFLDGLATKVYEFGGGTVKEHLGGIYDFLQKKKIDSLNELQKGVSLSTSPTTSAKGNEADTEQPSENRLSYEAQKELNKKIKKLERQVADCEASIEETESAIAILEAKMATPEGASDMQLYERHQKLKQQLDTTVEEWERVSMELEEVKN